MGHHYVPQAYLRRFCVEGKKQIIVFDKSQDRFFCTNVKNVAQEGGFYAPETEHQLATLIENPANKVFDKLIMGQQLCLEERRTLACYVGVLLKRVPSARELAERLLQPTVERLVGSARSQIEDQLEKREGDSAVLAKSLEEIEGVKDRLISDPPPTLREQMYSPWPSHRMVAAIAAMTWRIFTSDGPQYFVTTDNPAFIFHAYGLANRTSEFVLPLSTKVSLVGSWTPNAPRLQFVDHLRQPLVRELNRRLLSGSTRFIFSACEEEWIRLVAAKDRHDLSLIQWR